MDLMTTPRETGIPATGSLASGSLATGALASGSRESAHAGPSSSPRPGPAGPSARVLRPPGRRVNLGT